MTNLLMTILFALLPACPTEDSANCKWDAAHQGNGAGHSFIDIGGKVIHLW